MDRLVDMAAKAKLEPTTAESLAARTGVVVVAKCWFSSIVNMWGHQAWETWQEPVMTALALARCSNTNTLRVHVGDDAQTIRVLVDVDDALVVVYTSECTYHKSMARAMRRVLRVLKEQRKTGEAGTFVGSCSEMGGYDQDDEDDRPRGCA